MFHLWVLAIDLAVADPLVILNGPESKTKEVRGKAGDNAEFLTWAELREFPLAFGSVEESKSCLGVPIPLKDLKTSLKSAESAVAYLETKNAIGHVRQIQSSLVCVSEPVPTKLLARSSYIAGVAYNYDENLKLAKANWQQALMYDPSMVWDESIEPSGKPTFEEVKRNLESQATTRMIFMPNSAQITIDGKQPKSGETIIAGEHLIQHDSLGHQGHLIETEMGTEAYVVSFADFPSDLGLVMAESVSRNEMLRALLMVQDIDDIRVVTATDYWYLPMGTTKWKSQELKYVPKALTPSRTAAKVIDEKTKVDTPSVTTKPSSSGINKTLFYGGAGTVALGAASLIVANGYRNTFNEFERGVSKTDFNETFERQRVFWFAGTGLTVVGGGLMIGGTF